jgi:hypothetical protein
LILSHLDFMPKPKLVSTYGLGFEAAMKRLIATPPPPSSKKAKAAKKAKATAARN